MENLDLMMDQVFILMELDFIKLELKNTNNLSLLFEFIRFILFLI